MTDSHLLSGPSPDATVSLTVRIATLYSEASDLTFTWLGLVSGDIASEVNDGKLVVSAKPIISEIIIATTEVPAGIRFPVGGSSNKAFADFILKSRLLIWWPVLSAMNLESFPPHQGQPDLITGIFYEAVLTCDAKKHIIL